MFMNQMRSIGNRPVNCIPWTVGHNIIIGKFLLFQKKIVKTIQPMYYTGTFMRYMDDLLFPY